MMKYLLQPQEGNRVINYPPGHPYYTDEDGDDNESFIDIDGSVTGYPDMTVILPVPFHLTDACFIRLNWKMALCKHHYATVSKLLITHATVVSYKT